MSFLIYIPATGKKKTVENEKDRQVQCNYTLAKKTGTNDAERQKQTFPRRPQVRENNDLQKNIGAKDFSPLQGYDDISKFIIQDGIPSSRRYDLLDFFHSFHFHIPHGLVFPIEVGSQLKCAEHHRLGKSFNVTWIVLQACRDI